MQTGLVVGLFAALSLSIGLIRLSVFASDHDGKELLLHAMLYAVLTVLLGIAAWGVSLVRQWGWWLALEASSATVAAGAYRLTQVPPLGLEQPYGGWPAAGAWLTAALGGIVVVYLIAEFQAFRWPRADVPRMT